MCLDAPGGKHGEDCQGSSQWFVEVFEEMKWYEIVSLTIGVIICMVAAFLWGVWHGKTLPVEPIKEKVDTLIIHDTTMSYKPIYVERHKLDSVLVPVTDSVTIHDTLFVYLEREQVTWRDSLCEVYASGILPQVDSVRHFQESRIITIEKTIPVVKKTHWGIGVQLGGGAAIANGKVVASPYVGIGVSYNIISW